jgi:hypothetical protein
MMIPAELFTLAPFAADPSEPTWQMPLWIPLALGAAATWVTALVFTMG